ncbi:MAG: tyrosine-type recombinase/integrase, partial [Bacteroidota bacterium]
MKNEAQTEVYQELIRNCRAELKTLGYRKGTQRLAGLAEFLGRMETKGKRKLEQITAEDIKQHYAYLLERPSLRAGTLSQHTIVGYLFALRLMLDYAERHGIIRINPMSGLRFRRPKIGRKLVCSRADIQRLYAACLDDRERAILHLLYGCGLRRMEAEALNVGDVDYLGALLYVRKGKGKKRRVIPLTELLRLELSRYEKTERRYWQVQPNTKAFLLNDRGSRMRGNTIHNRLKVIVAKAQLNPKISAHILRHSIATH